MKHDIYKQVATRLDQMPNGFPATESGVELEILKKIFKKSEDAKRWLKLSLKPEPVELIADRFGESISKTQAILDQMVKNGQISHSKLYKQDLYAVMPFIAGIYEAFIYRGNADREYAELFEKYFPHFVNGYGKIAPAEWRVVPVNRRIDSKNVVYNYEDTRKIIEAGKSFCVDECVCRLERRIIDKPCPRNHSLSVCLVISMEDDDFAKYPLPNGKIITKAEALEINYVAEQEGLIHQSHNVKTGLKVICNCCSCCCGLLRGAKEFGAPHMMLRSNYVARIDPETCTSCGICAEERCQLNAIIDENGEFTVMPDQCIGCGVCSTACPSDSISMELRPEAECTEPEESRTEWSRKRATSRSI